MKKLMTLFLAFCAAGVTIAQETYSDGMENGYAYVDLGLPSGLKWATCNVGAADPWDCGEYITWDDAFYIRLGSWRTPTVTDQKELIDNCYWEWTDNYNGKGVKGYIVYKVKDANDKGKKKFRVSSTTTIASYSLSDAHIFLPAAGVYIGNDIDFDDMGFYWSSSLCEDYTDCVCSLQFTSIDGGLGTDINAGDVYIYEVDPLLFLPVRGVYDSGDTTAIEDTKESECINMVKYIDVRGNVYIVLPDGRVCNVVGAGVK